MSKVSGDVEGDEKLASHEGGLSHEDKDRILEIWKKAIETQMHFNEMSVKSRQLGLTFATASLGVAVVLIAKEDDFALSFMGWRFHVGVMLMLAATLAILSVSKLDLGVYHRMLRGAVTFGEDLENKYLREILDLEKGMTQAISHFSRYSDAKLNEDTNKYEGGVRITAEHKIRHFYRWAIAALLAFAVLLFCFNTSSSISNLFDPSSSESEAKKEVAVPTPTPTPKEEG